MTTTTTMATIDGKDLSVRLMHLNGNTQFHRDPSKIDPKLLWDARAPKIKQLIDDEDPDVACLVELRNLAAANVKVRDFFATIDGRYDVYCVPYNCDEFSFYAAILVRRSMFTVLETKIVSLGAVPENDRRRRICYGLRLRR